MTPIGRRNICAAGALGALLLLAGSACGPASRSNQASAPTPSPPGVAVGPVTGASIGPPGGTLASLDGRVEIVIPSGASAAATVYSIQEITNTAPAGVGSAYRLGPEGTTFSAPATLTFHADPSPHALDDLTVAYQDGSGYWVRVAGVTRDPVAQTLTVSTLHFSDWTIVTGPSPRDLSGTFTITSTIGVPFTADATATLSFAGENAVESYYLLSGTETVRSPITLGGATCTPDAPTLALFTNLAELRKSPAELRWGTSGHWNITCGGSSKELVTYGFDTIGMNLLGCARGYVGPQTVGPDVLAGSYTIDCGARGTLNGTWRFQTAQCGQPCASTTAACMNATWVCATGSAVCTDTGTWMANGTPCGSGMTCNDTACVQSRTVTGTRLVTYWADSGASPAAPAPDVVSPPLASVAALVPRAGGGFDTYPGAVGASGNVIIPTVPAGTYILAFVDGAGNRTFLETSATTVDLGYDVLGRADQAIPTGATSVTLDVSGLTPWSPGDQIQLTSSNANVFDVPGGLATIPAAATAASVVEDWAASGLGGPLNLVGPADVLWVHDLATMATTQAVGSTLYPYLAATNGTSVTGLAFTSGVPSTVAAAMTVLPGTGYVTGSGATGLDWRLPDFEAQLQAMTGLTIMPAGATHTLSVGAAAHALANPAPLATGTPVMFQLQLAAGTGAFSTAAGLSYGAFLDPTLWSEWRGIDFRVPVTYTLAAATVGFTDHAALGRREAMTTTPPTPIAPTVLPVQAPVINGGDAFTAQVGVTTTPTLSWSAPPPPSPVPSSYTVEIISLAAPGSSTVATRVARWRVASTRVTVPPNVLSAGGTYYARITANASTPDPLVTKPLSGEYATEWATALTNTFSP